MLSTHRAGKGGGMGVWGVEFRLNRTEGAPACLPPLVSESRAHHVGAQQASLGSSEWANALQPSPAPPVLDRPSRLPLLISPASLLCPQHTQGPEGALDGFGAQQAPQARVGRANALSSSPTPLVPVGPSRLPLLISLVSILYPQDPCSLEWALEGGRSTWELSRLPGPQWAGQMPSAPFQLLWS